VIEYKQQCLLDEKRQKALDLHLNYIVDQTAKYSDWLTQGLNQAPTSPMSKSSSKLGSDGNMTRTLKLLFRANGSVKNLIFC